MKIRGKDISFYVHVNYKSLHSHEEMRVLKRKV